MKCVSLILAFMLLRVFGASADIALTIVVGGRPASAIVPAGTVRVSYRIRFWTTDVEGVTDPTLTGNSIVLYLADAAGNIIYQEQYLGPTWNKANGIFETDPVLFEFHNPVDQSVQVMVVGERYIRTATRFARIGSNYSMSEPDNSVASRITVDTVQPPEAVPPANNPPSVAQESGSRIHAVIVSGRSTPEQVLRANGKTTLYGGLIGLGPVDDDLTPSAWSTGLLIVPDPDLLIGAKIPPIIPNIADVRIRHYSVEATMESAAPLSH